MLYVAKNLDLKEIENEIKVDYRCPKSVDFCLSNCYVDEFISNDTCGVCNANCTSCVSESSCDLCAQPYCSTCSFILGDCICPYDAIIDGDSCSCIDTQKFYNTLTKSCECYENY